ncbi:hypothetical protein [Leptolyngbya sp. FACHB-17]|uniref:hypothetical protein n=1 Tax=unclassified Leptolyngbya TaxID=2650499 RepID=UPI00167FFCB2|nr:hypothetical protein [Leptolyngbya sp. FACHB-17]MBD2078674.1 hypothetical protein [Leptolyngbya sp. FACHB-17]
MKLNFKWLGITTAALSLVQASALAANQDQQIHNDSVKSTPGLIAQAQSNTLEYWLRPGTSLFESKRYQGALAAYDKTLKLKSNPADLGGRSLVLSQLPDFSRPIEKKVPGFGGTIVSGFRYNPNTKEIGILLSGDHLIKPIIEKQGEQRPKNTDYNRVTIKGFRYVGIDVERREILVDARIRYQKLEKKPLGGLYTTFDQAADVTLGANFEVENRQLKTGTYIRRFKSDWASGPLGFIYSIFDAAFGVILWVAEGEFVKISDYGGTLASAYVNLAQPQRLLVDSLFSEVNEWNSQGLVYLSQTDYDPDGIWLLFKADPNQAQKLYQQLGNLVNHYFPDVSVNNQLNLVAANTSPIAGLSFDARFRAVNDWASKHSYVSAFPNFHQANSGSGLVYGGVLLNSGTAVLRDVPVAELGNPSTDEERFRAVNDWAARNGYVAGFPNFHQADNGQGVVFGVVLLNSGTAVVRDVPMAELGNPQTNEDRFRAVNDWAIRQGYAAAFPNFHQADHGQGVVFGVVLLNSGTAVLREIPVSQLR